VHGYSVGGTYRFLKTSEEQVADGAFIDVWHKLVPTKVSFFAWRILQDKIPTRANLVRRHILQPNDNLCARGCGLLETTDHLFIGCESFGSVWFLLCHCLGFPLFIQVLLRIITISLLTWWVCHDLLTCILRLFGLLVFGKYGRSETTEFSLIQLLIRSILLKKLS